MENRHLPHDLAQMQSVPLEGKIIMTQLRIRAWYEHFDGQVYVSFSGGKDSTVLKHIVDGMYSDVPAVFVNTGLEYPEIQQFVREIKAGKYDCFNSDIEILRPEMRFDEVLKKYGYPVITKTISEVIRKAKKNPDPNTQRMKLLNGIATNKKTGEKSHFNCPKWKYLLQAPFDVSEQCCDEMKKKPAIKYEEMTGRKPLLALMACESQKRKNGWLKTGCNAFDKKRPQSQPMAFWTEQDVLHYLKKYKIPYCTAYGEIVIDDNSSDVLPGQINMIDYLGCHDEKDILKTTGCKRTGCIYCAFGCHIESSPNRFQILKETHPRQYEYCINGGEYDESGKWQPSKQGLGLGKVLDYIGVKYD